VGGARAEGVVPRDHRHRLWDVDRGRIGRLSVYDAVDSAITGGLRAEIDSSLARQGADHTIS
jgi:hypothetical protein